MNLDFMARDRKPAQVVRDYYNDVDEAMRPAIGRGGRVVVMDRLALAKKRARRFPKAYLMTEAEREAKRRRP